MFIKFVSVRFYITLYFKNNSEILRFIFILFCSQTLKMLLNFSKYFLKLKTDGRRNRKNSLRQNTRFWLAESRKPGDFPQPARPRPHLHGPDPVRRPGCHANQAHGARCEGKHLDREWVLRRSPWQHVKIVCNKK